MVLMGFLFIHKKSKGEKLKYVSLFSAMTFLMSNKPYIFPLSIIVPSPHPYNRVFNLKEKMLVQSSTTNQIKKLSIAAIGVWMMTMAMNLH